MLPVKFFALLMDAVICGIDRWQTGEHETIDFDAEAYLPIHENSMAFLEDWLAEYGNEELHPKDLARSFDGHAQQSKAHHGHPGRERAVQALDVSYGCVCKV
ncbi:hypothetical protein B0H17DRAFT_1068193, partial [Mycena rosella]